MRMSEKVDLHKDLTILEILTFGSPVLIQKAAEITEITTDIVELARNMTFTMHAAPGIGLAAPQVAQSVRLITVDLSVGEKENQLIILINPEILSHEGETLMEEACLSVPEINEKVSRPERVVIKGVGLDGKEMVIEAQGLLARVFCHEIDHLNGKLFIEHLSPLKKNLIKKKLRKRIADGEET